ncbi:putative peptidase A22B, signal peptide peptidase [Helianthus annuus]|uniref:Peptidase A22B, signal peptide peptidase n=1 Tax=Helianthus annuus TaxID=4232 RepID=A0A9K3HQZ3_HELAN|nr:putative peptidase A22B, signal peptide peptidase [Helianthus annuus]KAJ0502501.1 putative peptidase A22B, signal peptide peptidase [Helianthus annuus]KAJ0518442.1 putative peptidase A22B, signal peptide peptidase [Helianthus annuus]KAJ0686476.1 putative peptidase A22B, signal peptide peptidase [Helianthus annuus]KAJ0690296.1 putative peptidase A22B, signal peptide peptidase [Helianthus annuus]
MLLALVLCFDHRKVKEATNPLDISPQKGYKYIWYDTCGYAVGLVAALAAGILTHSPQPSLLYLVPLTLGPIVVISWARKELWEGSTPNLTEKTHLTEV